MSWETEQKDCLEVWLSGKDKWLTFDEYLAVEFGL